MVVIYAEKSSLAKAIAHTLKAGKRQSLKDEPTVGYYEFDFKGEKAVLCHGVGHLAQLIPAKMYDEKYGKWDLSVFPCIPENFRTAPKSQTVKCLKLVKSFFDKADWVINATDPDREGELIFSYVYDICKCKVPFKRVWIEDLTDQKIQHAFDNLKEPDEALSPTVSGNAHDLQLAGRARDISDWLIGTNLTVAATKKFGGYDNLLTIGRVQTPTLNLVVEREKAILSHKKTPYWKITAAFSSPSVTFEADYEKGNFTVESEANAVLAECEEKTGIVTSIETEHKTKSAPLLFNTTQLLIAASKTFGWDSEKTSKIMQSLYDKKFMSYSRTSTEHLTDAMKSEVTLTIQKLLKMPEYSKYSLDKWTAFTKRHFDDSKVGSHTAIIPTLNVPENLDDFSEDEKQLYDLLAKSVIRMIYPKAEFDDTTAIITVDGKHTFKATGRVITNDGWYAVDARPASDNSLPVLSENQELSGKYALKKGETEPPKRYTEAALLSAMETAGQKIEDEEARTLMKMQKKGLGTDATRAPILKSLFAKNYIALKGKSIYPTELGMYIIDSLPVADLKSAEMTGELEKKLNDIAVGKADYDEFIRSIKETAANWFSIIAKAESKQFVSETEKQLVCPFCGKKLHKFDWGYGCSGHKDGCKFSVGNTVAGKKITENQIILLCKNGRTNIIKGFKSKNGSEFDAYLVADKKKNSVVFEFPNKK